MTNKKIFDYSTGPKIVAEISANHDGSLKQALELVHAAAEAGAHAVKLQTFLPQTMTLNSDHKDFIIQDENNLWNGYRLFDLYQKAYTPWEWHEEIFELAKKLGIIGFSSAFDITSVDFLESISVPCYKVASFESIDTTLIARIAATRKPMIISTGMANISEIALSVKVAVENGCDNLSLLKCTSAYPASNLETNLRAIPVMREAFQLPVGLSDHTLGIGAAVASVALGSVMIEKHIKISKDSNSLDAKFSLDPERLRDLVVETQNAFECLGVGVIGPTASEMSSRSRRRSLYFSKAVKSGDLITKDNIQSVRPGFGLEPQYFEKILGMRVARDVEMGTPLDWDILK